MKRNVLVTAACGALLAGGASAGVFINEVLINPPGSGDAREFIELHGTPGKKLDGYAIAVLNGTQQRFYPLGSIPPVPALVPEIDELFALDGLTLGPNGLLVLGFSPSSFYSTVLSDTNFVQWTTLWNGGLDTPGNLNNDGSNTLVLIRNRPGITPARPTDPLGLRWGKDIPIDFQLITPVIDPQDNMPYDQFGDGGIDKGESDGLGGNTLDCRGASTSGTSADDLEIVDEVSYEHDRGWEYDVDERRVDVGSPSVGLSERRVHNLDDPQGINPDCLTRVDYRTKGSGWTPVAGATGELPNGNNWQDTATEQWIRGESTTGTSGEGAAPFYYYSNLANPNPDAIQPYETQVPLWLADGIGADYNFTVANTYQMMAGRVNPLAIPYIPGDADRDGDADFDDIAKIAAVFGNNDWIFSNSFAAAPEGDRGDPATQTRPWDVDQTGDNGIECSDLQWTLNFQGNTNGRIVGRRYDSTTPSATGVYLNPSLPVVCEVTHSAMVTGGRPLTGLRIGDTIELTILGRVSAGVNLAPNQENGIMQFIHDLTLDTGGVVRVTGVSALGPYVKTRASLEALQGVSGDLGVRRVNGYTTSFTQGLIAAAPMYRVTLTALALGSTTLTVAASSEPKFAASTPGGLKVGHTNNNGNPGSVAYPAIPMQVVAAGFALGDMNCDGQVNVLDINWFVLALSDPGAYMMQQPNCDILNGDINGDGFVNVLDINPFVTLLSGG